MRPGTANRWERRPSPLLALRAVDSISILVISVISSCCVWCGAVSILIQFCFDFLLHVCTSEILFELFSVELLLVFFGFTVWVFLVPIVVLSYAVLILFVRDALGVIGTFLFGFSNRI